MAIEVDNLNARVVEAETRLKSEVTKIKKKMQIVITELEMSLDTSNKSNIELQKTVKKQAISLQVRMSRAGFRLIRVYSFFLCAIIFFLHFFNILLPSIYEYTPSISDIFLR